MTRSISRFALLAGTVALVTIGAGGSPHYWVWVPAGTTPPPPPPRR